MSKLGRLGVADCLSNVVDTATVVLVDGAGNNSPPPTGLCCAILCCAECRVHGNLGRDYLLAAVGWQWLMPDQLKLCCELCASCDTLFLLILTSP